jgi:hypothetical protein
MCCGVCYLERQRDHTGDLGLDPAGGASYTGITCAEVNAGAGVGGNVTLIADTIHAPTGCTTLPAGTGGGPATPTPTVSGVPTLTG